MYENSLCCLEAENDIIWTKEYLYKKEPYPKTRIIEETKDISHLRQDWWMYDDIPF